MGRKQLSRNKFRRVLNESNRQIKYTAKDWDLGDIPGFLIIENNYFRMSYLEPFLRRAMDHKEKGRLVYSSVDAVIVSSPRERGENRLIGITRPLNKNFDIGEICTTKLALLYGVFYGEFYPTYYTAHGKTRYRSEKIVALGMVFKELDFCNNFPKEWIDC